ncbi:MAG: hypothetical protein H6658_18645 [Ardenticatenaceae bacterium]|nr:hypothetical protein [Ardenticatenaceae bacterium]
MLAMAGMMSRPDLLLMDEPRWVGPILVEQNFELIRQINEEERPLFMVEQNANMAFHC